MPSQQSSDLVGQLRKLGLTASEAKAYLTVVKRGPSRAVEIARESSLQRTEIYRLMSRLVSMGLIEESLDTPRRYRPTSVKDTMHSLTERITGRLRTVARNSEDIATRLEALARSAKTVDVPEIRVIAGLPNIRRTFLEQVASTQDEVWMIVGPRQIARMPARFVADGNKAMASRHLKCRLIAEADRSNVKRLNKLPAFIDVRHYEPLDVYLYGFDNRSFCLGLTTPTEDITKTSQLLVTHHPCTRIMHDLFDAIWSTATPLPVQASKLRGDHTSAGQTQIIWGRQEIYKKAADWHAKAKEQIVGFTPIQGPSRILAMFKQLCLDSRNRGVRVQLVCRVSRQNLRAVKEISRIVEVRHTDLPLGRETIGIFDQSEAVMTYVDPDSPETDLSICTTNRGIVRDLGRFFDYVWANSVPISTKLSELSANRGKSVRRRRQQAAILPETTESKLLIRPDAKRHQ